MPNSNLTEIVFIIDRSGSMRSIKSDMEGGLKSFAAEQKKLPGEALLSIYTFDDVYETFCEGASLDAAETFELEPRSMTALLDAIGKTINNVGARISKTSEDQRPGKVAVVIVTDGHENASVEFKLSQISQMIKHQTDKYQWQFAFLGANIDSFAEAGRLGISSQSTMDYHPSAAGVVGAYGSLSRGLASYRSAGPSASLSLTPSDQEPEEEK